MARTMRDFMQRGSDYASKHNAYLTPAQIAAVFDANFQPSDFRRGEGVTFSRARADFLAGYKAWQKTLSLLPRTGNPGGGLRAQVRRLASGQIQLKIPLKRGENALRKAHQVAKALGRKVVSVAKSALANPQPKKYIGDYYKVGDFFIGKAPIPMPKGQTWSIYTREGQVLSRAGSMQAAAKKANQFMERGVVIEQ